MSYCSIQANEASLALHLKGRWTVAVLPEIRKSLSGLHLQKIRRVTLDGSALEDFDTSAAWYLNALVTLWKESGLAVEMRHFKEGHHKIFERISGLPQEKGDRRRDGHRPHRLHLKRVMITVAVAVGHQIDGIWKDCRRGIGFFGAFLTEAGRRVIFPQHLRLQSVVFHINEVGIKSIPIISLMAFSIAFVMGYQGAFQLQKFDATIYTVDLVVLSILREMGVLITAIMVAGRSGSAFAAQLGTMKLNEEVDALQTMGVSPFEVLVLPRLLAIIIALPLLTVVADLMGLLGGYVFASSHLGYSYVQFFSRMTEAADLQQFYVGVSKAPVFALLIGIVGCMQGLQAKGSAEDVGRKTITAVVQSIFLVILTDAIFSVIFTKLGI